MSLTDAVLQRLPEEVRRTLRAYVADVVRLFGPAFEGVLLYGSAARGEFLTGRSNLNLMILLSTPDRRGLERYAKAHRRWQREGVVVPLILTPPELRSAADWFPLELLDIQDAYLLLKGRDPFPELRVNITNLRAQCEQEIRGNLLRLRQRFVEGGGKPEAAAILLPLSLTALLAALRGLLRLLGLKAPAAADEVLAELGRALRVDPAGFQEVLALKRGLISPGALEVPRLFDRYEAGLQGLVVKLDHLPTGTPR